MDDEERKRKLEAGKAKLASYRKKKHSSKKKKHDTPQSTPRDPSQSEDVEACDSTAVQTGDESSRQTFTATDDSERSTTTAEDISTEEEGAYGLELTSVERIQELELTVSDQQVALQQLTLENKSLKEKNAAAYNEQLLLERESLIQELRDSVTQSAQHVRNLQQQLIKTTDAVIDTGGEQSQVVAELNETRKKLDTYQGAILRQENAIEQMAKKLEEKNLEAGEAAEKIHSLQIELDKSQSVNQEHVAEAMRLLRDEFEQEKDMLKAEWDVKHLEEIALMQNEHREMLDEEIRKRKKMEEQQTTVYDPEDARAFREQAELLRSQLENAYRDVEKLKRDHDKEVIDLSQQLVSSADEYESKLQAERQLCEELEQKLEMSDTVSSEIQSSFSKQLEQLEEERDLLRQQLRQSQSQAKDHSNSKTRVNKLEEEILSYQTELADMSRRLEEAEKQKRHFRDEMERSQEALGKTKKENSQVSDNLEDLNEKISNQNKNIDELYQKLKEISEERDAMQLQHKDETNEFEKKISDLLATAQEERSKVEERMKVINKEQSEELKNLHSQHHRQMEELKKELEKELEESKYNLEHARKKELETVKDVHERNHDRELARMRETHDEEIRVLVENHKKEMETLQMDAQMEKDLSAERLRIEMKEEFDLRLEKELTELEENLRKEAKLVETEMKEKHNEEMEVIKASQLQDADEMLKKELETQKSDYKSQLIEQKKELDRVLDEMQLQFNKAQEEMADEHTASLAKMENDYEESSKENEARLNKSKELVDKLQVSLEESETQKCALQKEVEAMQEKLAEEIQRLQEDHEKELLARELSSDERKKLEEEKHAELQAEIEELKEDLLAIQTERDQIFTQAEESQKRLAALHHEDSIRMQEELDQLEANHQEKVEQMQYEIESLRASRTDLQDLKSQLLARNASVEELSLVKEEFAKEKEELLQTIEEEKEKKNKLQDSHQNEIEELKESHRDEIQKEQERISQLLQDLEESREKLDEVTSSSLPLESSPLRSVSQMSDYDTANVPALSKDYRSAMTLTHVSGVSGLSESLGVVAEQLDDEDNNDEKSPLMLEMEALQKQFAETNEELAKLGEEHKKSQEKHAEDIEQLNADFQEKLEEMLKSQQSDMLKASEAHQELVDNLKDAHQREITHVHLQCASDTAKQIEEETASIRKQLQTEHQQELEDLKQELELESKEKLDKEVKKHAHELSEQTTQLSSSLEVRISAVMEELHEQKQQALRNATEQHERQLAEMEEDLNKKMKEMIEKEENLIQSFKEREKELEVQVDDLDNQYKKLIESLESGENNYLRSLKDHHEDEIEKLRRRLEAEHDERQEHALQKQANTLQQAQSEFMKLHKEQFDRFINGQKQDAEAKDSEMAMQLEDIRRQLAAKQEDEKNALISHHNEEMKVVATKLVEIDGEKQSLINDKNQLLSDIEAIKEQHTHELAELKTTLVNQHLVKFQEVTLNLDQLHKEEMENVSKQHQERVADLRSNIDSLQEQIDCLQSALRKEEEAKESMITLDDMDEKMKELREDHMEECKKIQDDHDAHLQQINEEIKKQAEEHQNNMKNVIDAQTGDLSGIKQQFDLAVQVHNTETQKLQDKIMDLEERAKEAQSDLEMSEERKKELDGVVEEWRVKMQAWNEERDEEREAYESKLNQLSENLQNLQEEYKDLNTQIDFERMEYESEIENAQSEIATKDENIKELQAEIDHKNAALESLTKHREVMVERMERESQEANNSLKMLREDIERLNSERDNLSSSNEQLLSALTDLVRTNHKCEELITKRLENLPIKTSRESSSSSSESSSGSEDGGHESRSSSAPSATNLSGSFIDEGLDLSQRLTESMFTGPELDSSARDVISSARQRVEQATIRALDMLDDAIRRFNSSQQAQTMLSNELEQMLTREDENTNDETKNYQDIISQQAETINDLQSQTSTHQKELESLKRDSAEELENKKADLEREFVKLEEEKALLAKQKVALTDGRDETELNFIKTTEELSKEKELLVEQHQQEKSRLVQTANQLEEAMEQLTKLKDEKENDYLNQIEDLAAQIDSLQKQTASRSRFAAELTSDRQAERDQFDLEMEAMRNEIDQVRDTARSEAMLAEKVSHLEEALELKERDEKESVDEINKLKDEVRNKNNQITDLQTHIDANKTLNQSSEHDVYTQLEESRAQVEVLQKELYENMLRTSALEAQLDRYRHGVDESALASLEKSEEEERRMKEQALYALEEKEQEIEHLIDQQNSLRNQVIEKEEEVEKLLEEMEDINEVKAENNRLKEDLDEVTRQLAEQEPSQSDHLEALSQQLLNEKNAEIDDLRQQLSLLQNNDQDNAYQKMLDTLNNRVRELQEQLEQYQEQASDNQDPVEEEEAVKDSSDQDEDTGIQDLSVADQTRSGSSEAPADADLQRLAEENHYLHEELETAKKEAENLLGQFADDDVFKLPPGVKEKIRDLEEKLNKEQDEKSSDESDPEDESSPVRRHIDQFKDQLDEIEEELHSVVVLGAILRNKTNTINANQALINQLQDDLQRHKHELEQLKQEIPVRSYSSSLKDDEQMVDDEDEENLSHGEEKNSSSDEEKSSSSDEENEEKNYSSDDEEHSEEEDVVQLKMLLSVKEDKISKQQVLIAKQIEEIQQTKEKLSDVTAAVEEFEFKFDEVSAEFNDKCQELEEYKSKNPESLSEKSVILQQAVEKYQSTIDEMSSKISSKEEERFRVSKMLDDVQRECSSLLEDNKRLEEEKMKILNELSLLTSTIEQLESQLKSPHSDQVTEEISDLKEKIEVMNEEIEGYKMKLDEAHQENEDMKIEYYEKQLSNDSHSSSVCDETDKLQTPNQIHAGGDTVMLKHSLPLSSSFDDKKDVRGDVSELLLENEHLKEEVSNLAMKTEQLQIELNAMKQKNLTAEDGTLLLMDDNDVSKMNEINQSLTHQSQLYDQEHRKLSSKSRGSSATSQSSDDIAIREQIEELKKEHQIKMEKIKEMYSREMEEAVTKATIEQEERSQMKLSELEEKHRLEITGLLSDSSFADNELAQRLRNELDLADKLDHEIIAQLQSVNQKSSQPIEIQTDPNCSTSSDKEVEISTRLQHLLSRLHNEGVQVLSLSELQFLKQYQPLRNVSINTEPQDETADHPQDETADHLQDETTDHPPLDVEGLKRAWENEKLALLDAIQSLKELLIQTATDSAQLTDDDENIKWRGEMLRSVADLFEREKRALLAELQACVIEAQSELDGDCTASSRLEALEQKLRVQELQHRSELERLLAADRDQLADDIKQLKEDRKEKIEESNKRFQRLHEQHKMAEESNKLTINQLQNEVECLRSKVEQEEALVSDLRTSLKLEKQRSCDLLPALDSEQNKVVELSTEIAALSEANQVDMKEVREENEKLRSKVEDLSTSLDNTSDKLNHVLHELHSKNNELEELKSSQDQVRFQDQKAIEHLQEAFTSEKDRRMEAVKAVEEQLGKMSLLHKELADEKGKSYEEIVRLNNKCDDLSAVAQAEKRRSEDLRSALEREASAARKVRMELEKERKTTSEARDQERATVCDLQTILEDAKKETEHLERRVELAERERDEVLLKAEEEQIKAEQRFREERLAINDTLKRERKARSDFQTALDTERLIKEDLQKRVEEVEEEKKKLLRNHDTSPRDVQDSLLTSRRQLEAVRQRLQLETAKFQNLVNRTSAKPPPSNQYHLNTVSSGSSLLSSDGERLESLKRALNDVQDELKELHSTLTIPTRGVEQRSVRPIEFNDRLLKQNAELSQFVAETAKETKELRDAVDAVGEGRRRSDAHSETETPIRNENEQKMANRLHKLYTRYLRAESFRKSLVYQKKYLLLLLGGFQDCEEATLAMIARMGAYPSDDALRRSVTRRSEAFTKFRSAARVVIAVCRLKYLVRKWKRANDTVSTAIQNKHGVPVVVTSSNAITNGNSHGNRFAPSPSPRLEDSGASLRHSFEHHLPVRSHSPYHRYSNDPPSRDTSPFTSGSHLRSSTSPYNPPVASSSYDAYPRNRAYTPYTDNYSQLSPAPVTSYSAMERTNAADTDPSLNEYIQKLENIQNRLRYPR